jgi:hypothetical protein
MTTTKKRKLFRLAAPGFAALNTAARRWFYQPDLQAIRVTLGAMKAHYLGIRHGCSSWPRRGPERRHSQSWAWVNCRRSYHSEPSRRRPFSAASTVSVNPVCSKNWVRPRSGIAFTLPLATAFCWPKTSLRYCPCAAILRLKSWPNCGKFMMVSFVALQTTTTSKRLLLMSLNI